MKNNSITASITAVGKFLPSKKLTNFDLEKMVDTNDEWIRSRTGIEERRIVEKGQASSYMSVNAFKNLQKNYNINSDEIDVIIVATVTPDMLFPSTACIIQDQISAKNAFAFDLSGACSGFLFALDTATRFIESGKYKKVLVFGVDTMSSVVDYTDRNTCILFGDGAGVVLVEPSKDENGIIDSELKTDGSGAKYLMMKAGGSLHPATHETVENKEHFGYQDGATVYKYAVKGMADISKEVSDRNNLTSQTIDLFIPHQANKRIIDSAAKRLGIPNEKVLININKYANTTAGTIPIALTEAVEQKMLKKGDNVILSSFGAGFTWGAIYLKWGIS
ncbi:MAG: ketoacyl-ACP synthase III [Candidatus Marinimicrobia bacterium]|nr:ketoacyl-ACP synthase III [Candidatus Neomarinimicrobiota bacterium]